MRNCSAFFQSKSTICYVICLLLLFTTGCAFMDDDGIIFEEQIIGKFYIRQQARSNQIGLQYVEDLHSSTGIVEDCNKLVFDSVTKEIFVEERLWDSASSYYLINIIDANAENSLGAYKKKEIYESTFLNKLYSCRHCKVLDIADKRKAYQD